MCALYEGDCLKLLPFVRDEAIDTVFVDPPFNLSKVYGSKVNDNRPDDDYISWCKEWLDQCIRVLKPGGAIFVYSLPKWNIILGNYLAEAGLTFRHWIAVNIKLSLPIHGRLYLSHYSLLYYTKGKPKTFRKIRTPIEVCRHCGKELKDLRRSQESHEPDSTKILIALNRVVLIALLLWFYLQREGIEDRY